MGVQGQKIKYNSGFIFPFGESPKLEFYSGAFAHFEAHFGFCGSGAQNQILFRGILPIIWVPNSNLT
jgi:hypothetical protein